MHQQPSTGTQLRERFLRLPEVEHLTGMKKSAIYAAAQAGTFPPSIRLARRCVAWRESEVQQWIADRIAERQP